MRIRHQPPRALTPCPAEFLLKIRFGETPHDFVAGRLGRLGVGNYTARLKNVGSEVDFRNEYGIWTMPMKPVFESE